MFRLLLILSVSTLCCCSRSEKLPTTIVLSDNVDLKPGQTPQIKKPALTFSEIPNVMDTVLKGLSAKERKLHIKHMTQFYSELEATSKRAYANAPRMR